METRISSKASGEWILEPTEPTLPFTGKSWLSFRASTSTGVLDYEIRETSLVQLHVFHLRMNNPDLLKIDLTHCPYTLLFQLLGFGIFVNNPGHTRTFYERSCNLLSQKESMFHFQFPGPSVSLSLLICFQDEFALSLEEEIPLSRNSGTAFLTGKNIIIDRFLLDLLSEILFPDCSSEWEDFILEELIRSMTHWMMDKKDQGPFQPLHLEKTDADWFQAMKQQLLSVKNKAFPFQRLLKTAGILEVRRFRKLLKSFYGLTIQELLTEARMAEAQTLLRTTDLPIKQIAADTGYKNIYYFTRIFNQYTGMPPAQFQKMNEG